MKIRRHLSYANVVATLALSVAIGGTGAYAAGLIGSGDVANNSLRSKDLKNRKAVKAVDVRRDGLTGKELRERTFDAAEFAPLAGDQGSCDPADATFVDCAETTINLKSAARVMVIATGEFHSEGAAASLTCRIAVDGVNSQAGASPGEETTDNTSLIATDGLSATLVSDQLPQGQHQLALRCSQPSDDDGRLGSASIAVLGVSG